MKRDDDDLTRALARVLRLLEELVAKPVSWQPWMDSFLEDLKRHRGNATAAIDLSGKSRGTVYKYRRGNEEFDRRWSQICGARD